MKKVLISLSALIVMSFTLTGNKESEIVYVFNFENYGEKRIEIYPINGKPSWSIEYDTQWYNEDLKCEVYSNSFASVSVGEDWAIYSDDSGEYKFEIIPCVDNESNTIKNK